MSSALSVTRGFRKAGWMVVCRRDVFGVRMCSAKKSSGTHAGNLPLTPGKWDIPKNQANYTELSPISFLRRAERTFPNHVAVIHGKKHFTWKEVSHRASCVKRENRRLAAALIARGVKPGDTISVVASNTPEMVELHWAVPITGAVINSINTRLDPAAIAFCIDHSESSFLFTDSEFAPAVRGALALVKRHQTVVDICDSELEPPPGHKLHEHVRLGSIEYEGLIKEASHEADFRLPPDEWDPIALGYTSGTTGDPKGVVTHHRGAYLNALSNAVGWDMAHHPKYLWTLPMFHCNGWCFPWTLAAVAGTSVCLRKVTAKNIYDAIADRHVTHLCGAPTVLNFIVNARPEERRNFDHKVKVMTAAAPPPPSTLERMQRAGFEVTHVYGLTETYGPAVICSWHKEWDKLPVEEQVMDPETMTKVPADGKTMGEVMFRGNIVMKGYLKNPATTDKELRGGWFHSGDLGVMHADGYIELKDRAKDIIITGGENVSSIEVEGVLTSHPEVAMAAVVARPDTTWGESVCAFVELRDGPDGPDGKGIRVTEQDLIKFCRERMAAFKCPRSVLFQELPKTSTGKVQKYKLRVEAKALGSL